MDVFLQTITETFLNEMLGLNWLELTAALLALAYVLLAAKQNIWCWLCAFASSGIYVAIFWQAALPYQAALNFFYVAMALYGWATWRRVNHNGETPKVRQLGMLKNAIAIFGLTLVCAILLSLQNNASMQNNAGQGEALSVTHYLDAGIAVFSVFTTWLVVQKYLDNWVYWIVLNTAAAWLYASQSLYFTAALFSIYVLMSLYGLISWRGAFHKSEFGEAVILQKD